MANSENEIAQMLKALAESVASGATLVCGTETEFGKDAPERGQAHKEAQVALMWFLVNYRSSNGHAVLEIVDDGDLVMEGGLDALKNDIESYNKAFQGAMATCFDHVGTHTTLQAAGKILEEFIELAKRYASGASELAGNVGVRFTHYYDTATSTLDALLERAKVLASKSDDADDDDEFADANEEEGGADDAAKAGGGGGGGGAGTEGDGNKSGGRKPGGRGNKPGGREGVLLEHGARAAARRPAALLDRSEHNCR